MVKKVKPTGKKGINDSGLSPISEPKPKLWQTINSLEAGKSDISSENKKPTKSRGWKINPSGFLHGLELFDEKDKNQNVENKVFERDVIYITEKMNEKLQTKDSAQRASTIIENCIAAAYVLCQMLFIYFENQLANYLQDSLFYRSVQTHDDQIHLKFQQVE